MDDEPPEEDVKKFRELMGKVQSRLGVCLYSQDHRGAECVNCVGNGGNSYILKVGDSYRINHCPLSGFTADWDTIRFYLRSEEANGYSPVVKRMIFDLLGGLREERLQEIV